MYGHGGGESGYKEALQQLKSTSGDQTVIKAVHLSALNQMEAQRNDPLSLKSFAEHVRTHIFNLSTIRETGHADIIERLTRKLELTDRLAWSDGRGADMEIRTISEFGRWCDVLKVVTDGARKACARGPWSEVAFESRVEWNKVLPFPSCVF